jgi:hypothetical protein
MMETPLRAVGFVGWLVAVWVGGVAIFAHLFARARGTVLASDEPTSIVANASFIWQLITVSFCLTWLFGLTWVSWALFSRIVS